MPMLFKQRFVARKNTFDSVQELIYILRQQISAKTIAMNGDTSDRSDDTALMHLPNPFNDTMSTRDEQGTFLGQVIREVSARNGFRARSVQSRSDRHPCQCGAET